MANSGPNTNGCQVSRVAVNSCLKRGKVLHHVQGDAVLGREAHSLWQGGRGHADAAQDGERADGGEQQAKDCGESDA